MGAGNTADHLPTCASGPGAGLGAVSDALYVTVRYGRWLTTGSSLLLKNRYRSRSLDGSEFNNRPKFVAGALSHPCTMDVTSHCLNPAVLSMLRVSTGALMSACARGMCLRQHALAVHAFTPSYV